MATLKDYKVSKKWGVRPDNNVIYIGNVWLVEKCEPYDLVQFSIEEIKGYYWTSSLCVKCDLPEEKIKELVEEFVSQITDKQIKDYQYFLDMGNKYGWD